jgi:hypothetical protein
MITNLKDINELMKEQEEREQHKQSLVKRLESITRQTISKGIKEKPFRKALSDKNSLREKLIIILQNIKLANTDFAEIESEITKTNDGPDNNIDQLFELCEQKLKQLDLNETKNNSGHKILCLKSNNSIFGLTRKARKFLRKKYMRRTEEIDDEKFDLIYLPLYKIGLQLGKSSNVKPLQILVHAVSGGIFVNNRSRSVDFKRVFSARQRRIHALEGRESELITLPEEKGSDIVVIREEISIEKLRHYISTAFNAGQISDDNFTLVYLPILRFYLKSKRKDDSGEFPVRTFFLDSVFGKIVDTRYIPV